MQIQRESCEIFSEANNHCPTGVISVLLNLTHQCNLACKYCIMQLPELQAGYQNLAVSMDEELVRDAIDFIRQVGLRGTNLTFFGGEPLMRFDLLQAAVEYAERKYPDWFVYNVITNATLLKPEMAEFIKNHGIRFLFSIDGDKAANDCLRIYKNKPESVFETAWGNIQQMLQLLPELEYKVNITYFRPTLDLARSFRFLLTAGVPETRFERGLAPEDSKYIVRAEDLPAVKEAFSTIAQLYQQHLLAGGKHVVDNFVVLMRKIVKHTPRWRGCNMGIDYLTIAADGQVYPCHKMVGHSSHSMGHVRTVTNNDQYLLFWQRNVLQREQCCECEDRFLCGGFCICDNYFYCGDFFTPTPANCEIIRHNIALAKQLVMELEMHNPLILKRLLGRDYLLDREMPYVNSRVQYDAVIGRVRQLDTGGEYELNSTASMIFAACDGVTPISDIAARIAINTMAPLPLVIRDVKQQLGIFQAEKIIEFIDTTES